MTFAFSENDLRIEACDQNSKFDDLLLTSWDAAMEANRFRYDLKGIRVRVVPGRIGYVLQFNHKRFAERRKPEVTCKLDQPLDPQKFNFSKVSPHEVLFRLAWIDKSGEKEAHPVLINVSPIERGHVLLVPECSALHNQVMRRSALEAALRMLLLSGHRNFCIGYNSLLGFASVNHLHLHGWYSEHRYFACRSALDPLSAEHHLFIFRDHPVRGFVFVLKRKEELEQFIESVMALMKFLHTANVPHNAFLCRSDLGVRACVWPRRPVMDHSKNARDFNVAVAELAGLLVCQSEAFLRDSTESEIISEVAAVGLPEEEFSALSKNFVAELS